MAKDKSANIINWIAGIGAAYFIGSAIAGAIKRKREAEGVGKVERIKRRIYKEVSLAQQAGVDFSKKFPDLTAAEKEALVKIGEKVGWKQSKRAIESGKPYAESYYNSLRRAWNAVSGVESIGRAYNVKDENGNVVLTWIEDAAAHVEAERRTLEAEARAAEARKSLAKSKRALTTSPIVATKTKQQQILEKVPYLRTIWDAEDGVRNEVRDDFQYVVWIEMYNENTGEKIFEGAKIATLTKSMADSIANDERRSAKFAHERSDGNTTKIKISVIPVNKVNIDRISGVSGIGIVNAADILEPELLDYIRTNIDPDEVAEAMDNIDRYRYSLPMASYYVNEAIQELTNDWCDVNGVDPDDIWSVVDAEDILWAL